MAPPIYVDAHRNACCNAITALGNRIGLYDSTGARVGTIFADTTWGAAYKINEAASSTDSTLVDKARSDGSKVTLVVPGGTVANNTTITHYGVHNGTTLLRRIPLTMSVIVNDGSQDASVDVTPTIKYRGE